MTRRAIRRLQCIPLQALLVVPFAAQVCIAVGVTTWLSWRNGQQAVNELVLKAQSELGDRVKLKIGHYLEVPVTVTRLNAEAIRLGQLPIDNLDQAEPILFQRLKQFKTVSGILMANREGSVRAINRRDGLNLLSRDPNRGLEPSSMPISEYRLDSQGNRQVLRQTFEAPDVRNSAWYRSAVEAGELTWSPIFQTGDRPDLSLNASMPVYNQNQEFLGVVSSGIVLSVIGDFLHSLDVSLNGGVFVVDRDGNLIGSSSRNQPVYQPLQSIPSSSGPNLSQLVRINVNNARDPLIRETSEQLLATYGNFQAVEATTFDFRGSTGRNFVKVIPCNDEFGMDWLVMVVIPEQDFMERIHRNSRTSLALSGVALLSAIGLGYLTARILARSILRLSRLSQAIARGELDHTLSENSPIAEVATVARSFNQMVEQLSASFVSLETQVEERTLQLQQSFDYEATLKRLTDKVRDSLEEDHILQTAVEELALAVGVRGCNAAIYDSEKKRSTVRYEYTNFPQRFQGRQFRMQNFAGYEQLLQGQYFQHCGLQQDPSRGRVAMLSCPLQDDQGVLGDLWLIKPASEAFEKQEIRLVQQVANQCAIAIRQARLYQAAQAQVVELERLNQLKDDFLSTVSHELRTPISNMKMAIQMLEISLQRRGSLDNAAQSPVQRYFEILKDECQRESALINNLLDLSRLTAESEPLELSKLHHPQAWLEQLVRPFIQRSEGKQQFHLQISAHLPSLETDATLLERILTELLNNACKYTPSGEAITFSVALTTGQAYPVRTILFQVQNSGIEIAPQEQELVFERFYRVPNGDPWKHGGTGLGLALVRGLTQRLGGTVTLESAHNLTSFTVQLPIVHQPQTHQSKANFSQTNKSGPYTPDHPGYQSDENPAALDRPLHN